MKTITIDTLQVLLRECDAARGMLSDMPPVVVLRAKICETILSLTEAA